MLLQRYYPIVSEIQEKDKMLALSSSPTFCQFPPRHTFRFRVSTLVKALSSTTSADCNAGVRTSYEGVKLEEKVAAEGAAKTRLDTWISTKINGISRARVQSSIRAGLVCVNGRIVDKVSYAVRTGDEVNCTIAKLQPLRADAEDIPLDIIYEDDHVLVVNKPPHMVVHPAPGNPRGTLVNAVLNHCSLPNAALTDAEWLSEADDVSEDDLNIDVHPTNQSTCEETDPCSIRPGIVHRLDKGTSGLLVVAKNEHSHANLAEQFKAHTVNRVYLSVTSGLPTSASGRVEVHIGRDLNNRIRMTAITGNKYSGSSRHAASRYKVLEVLANGGAALVEWRLETGRTHQIRVHAKYLGIPLVGDELYGGTKDMTLSLLRQKNPCVGHLQLDNLVSSIERPCLHAMVLGFKHPCTGKYMHFSCPPPVDFAEILSQLRNISK
ncbi:RNA pseudouridine synthase 2, chloroplastic isoform X2 [Spinacia oleracea]|uniref:RNA pseudouridine synthase 2, chloroplastic isoform X2 n=1 Tax=Spinacia oleracea TaxID=3562 RepID=A0A9R0JKV3_SPIOL|nr:RNA pseudouridine synthase 2, chloroplastic isoform X2 [Spinacia oleracea]